QRKVIAGKRDTTIIGVDPVGNYAVKLTFDDLHDTGIFTWAYFQEMNDQKDFLWNRYLSELQERGLSRELSK
ncbi:gamma-butyrobetaine hydroxylase-like domain-containing protein, partial [Pseudovibrio sp. POLY-S9]